MDDRIDEEGLLIKEELILSEEINNEEFREKLYMYHYLSEHPIVVFPHAIKGNDNQYILQHFNGVERISNYDPVLIIRIKNYNIKVTGGHIVDRIPSKGIVSIKPDYSNTDLSQRLFKRYPASYYVDIKERESKKRQGGIIKDISKYGMKIYTRSQLEIKKSVEINISYGVAMFFVDATVMNEVWNDSYFEYGLSISPADVQSIRDLRVFSKHYQVGCVKKIDPDVVERSENIDFIFESDEESSMSKMLESAAAKLDTILKRSKA